MPRQEDLLATANKSQVVGQFAHANEHVDGMAIITANMDTLNGVSRERSPKASGSKDQASQKDFAPGTLVAHRRGSARRPFAKLPML
jgi:hypothetical protein